MIARCALAAAVALAGCQHDQPVGEVSGVLFGAAVVPPTATVAALEQATTDGEALTGRKFDLHRIYHKWTELPGELDQWTIASGRTPLVSFKTDLQWADLAAGAGDAQLNAMASAYAALGVPLFLMFDQNPENTPTQGTPADFAAAFRHVVETFRAAGVTNVQWVFNLKSPSFPDLADQFYPGDDVIDWLGVGAYNYGINTGGRWVSFNNLIADWLAWATPRGKPMMVSEWGCEEDQSQPGRKAAWIEDVETTIHELPQVRAISAQWVEGNAIDFNSSPSSMDAFRALAADPYTHLREP